MYGRNEIPRITEKFGRILALGIAFAMLCCMLPMPVAAFTLATPSDIPTDHVQEDSSLLCTCENRCTDESINSDCPVCSADHTACIGTKQPTATLPEYELEERELDNEAEDGARITVSGLLPTTAVLAVAAVPIEDVAEFVSEGARVLFAYDIKIMLPGDPEPTEYQPGPDNPLTVTITPPKPIEAPAVEILHIAEDTETGETTPQTVQNVVTTAEGAVEFAADGFSVYIGTTTPTIVTDYPTDMYWNGTYFYSDAACNDDGTKIVDSGGDPITTLPTLLEAIDAQTTIYMKAAYTVSDTESISGGTHTVSLKRHSSNTSSTLITVPDDAALTLGNITIDGADVDATNTALLVESGGMLTIEDGTVIEDNILNLTNENDTQYGGGGVRVCGTATMTGGTIQNNKVEWNKVDRYGYGGAGVAVVSDGRFTMNGGSITGNEATSQAGGGGVLLYDNAGFTMDGGSIDNNRGAYGGAIYNYGKNVIINGGTISNNKATNSCGGIYCASSHNLTINGGLITGNICNGSTDRNGLGGAININSGDLTITGGSIMGNIAAKGDAIYTQNFAADVIITGGTVSGSVFSDASINFKNNSTPPATVVAVTVTVPGITSMTEIDSMSITDANDSPYDYGCTDLFTDASGRLYLWLPEGCTVNSVVINSESIDIDGSGTNPTATLSYPSLTAGSTLTALLSSGTAYSWQWQISDNGTSNWADIIGSANNSYTTTASDADKHIRVIITDINAATYASTPVNITANNPTYTITIPESVSMSVADSFSIGGELDNFLEGQSVTVVVDNTGGFYLNHTVATTNTLGYTLYTDTARNNSLGIGGTAATFTKNGSSTTPIYYSISDTPTYSGRYTGTLTFTVTLYVSP